MKVTYYTKHEKMPVSAEIIKERTIFGREEVLIRVGSITKWVSKSKITLKEEDK